MADGNKPEPEGKPDADKELEEFKKSHLEDPDKDKGGEEPPTEPEEGEEGKEDDLIDHEAELAKERERADKAEKAAAEEAFKRREVQRKLKEKEEEPDDEEDKPLTRRELQEVLSEERQIARREAQAAILEDKVAKKATSGAEKSHVLEILRTRRWPDYVSLDDQIDEAFAIANRKRLLAKNEELKRSLRGKENAQPGGAGTHQPPKGAAEPKLSSQEVQVLKEGGYSWDAQSQLYKKSVGKKTLYYDPKTKRRFVK